MSEKRLNDVSHSLRELYEKGNAAFQRKNYGYAVEIFNQILKCEPSFYAAREALRAVQFKIAGEKRGLFKRVFSTAASSPLIAKAQLSVRNNPVQAINAMEQILERDPYNTMAHKTLADAAMVAGFTKTAILSLELALKNDPGAKDIRMKLATALADDGKIPRAEEMLSELSRAYPNDNKISQALKDLTVKRTMVEGGYEGLSGGEGSYRDILKDKKEAVRIEQEQREVKSADVTTDLLTEYEERLKEEPKNYKLMRTIAELYAQRNDYDKSLEYYGRLLESEVGNDPSLDRAYSNTVVRKFNFDIEQLDSQAPDYEETVKDLERRRDEFKLQAGRNRVEKYPADLQIRFEMGQLYYEAGKVMEAIQEFQKSQANPHRRIASLHYLGRCFAARNMNDLAVRSFQNALKEKELFDDEKKGIIYDLGCVLEKMDKKQEAIELFKQIFEVDIGYKDVAARVDDFYAQQ
ncbi:MAG: tetratricopeptide repeat protein [Verrucomicrobia bacterium]|nr:tetratricopeptide repeat protein [Verrucomicrobiota bacterium]MCF7708063.1 tetratricopeptide repeat protein [Verrucomicrobiota bacterium]